MPGAEQADYEVLSFSPSQQQPKVIFFSQHPTVRADHPSPGRHKHPSHWILLCSAPLPTDQDRDQWAKEHQHFICGISYPTLWGFRDSGQELVTSRLPSGAMCDQHWNSADSGPHHGSATVSSVSLGKKHNISLAAGFHSHKIGNSTLPYLQSALRSFEAQGYGSVFITSIRRYIGGGSQSTLSRSTTFIF